MSNSPLITVRIINLPQIISAFRLAPSLMKPALTSAINKSLLTIGREADKNLQNVVYKAPISKSGYKRTGNLLSSVLDPNRGLQLARDGVFSGSVGSGVGYGLFVEMGTKFMAARPFLQPAVDSTQDQVTEFFVSGVQSVLDTIAGAANA